VGYLRHGKAKAAGNSGSIAKGFNAAMPQISRNPNGQPPVLVFRCKTDFAGMSHYLSHRFLAENQN
jgi:hypothetical protein